MTIDIIELMRHRLFMLTLFFFIFRVFMCPVQYLFVFIFDRVFMCTFSLATSFAAILLLPGSVIGNEIIHRHPGNYYVQWLTNSLVQG